MPAPKKYLDELPERGVRMVFEIREQTGQRKGALARVGEQRGITHPRAASRRHHRRRGQPARPRQPAPQGQERPGRRRSGRPSGPRRPGHRRPEEPRGNSAVKATTTASNQIKALLVGADQDLRDRMRVQSLLQVARRCIQLAPANGLHLALASLGRRWLLLHDEVLSLDRAVRDLVRRTVPCLLERPGVGIHSAAQLLITPGGNPERLHSDAAFAALCGASPVQASSGRRHRHRLSRGGDRQANNALWTIANNRMIHDQRTREFDDRRRQRGDSRKATLRVLKRYIARETFNVTRTALSTERALADAA